MIHTKVWVSCARCERRGTGEQGGQKSELYGSIECTSIAPIWAWIEIFYHIRDKVGMGHIYKASNNILIY